MRFEFVENGVIVQRESVLGKIASMNLSLHGRSAVAFLTAYDNWRAGDLIQDAFSWLDDGEREFLMTGLTPSEWDKLFG
jgi:hypothetical protein